ncbi:Integrase catalytic domain-containing protein [Abeliophyllum distichum]|uniref:Integrase catalytic domain-containing protein n=1 Tax=Abeliophyllum distichum TaxID=126358 RepID=A0ABD1RS95_9LAMI
MKCPKRYGLYYLQGEALHAKDSRWVSINTDRSDIWHRRMGHIENKGLKYLSSLNLLDKDTVAPLSFCETCVLVKSHRVIFEIGQHNTKRPLDYIHANLLGLEKYPTHGRNMFFLSIVDDYSRKVEEKLDPRDAKRVILGYLELVKEYRLWVLSIKDNQVKRIGKGESSIGKKIQTEVKRLDVNQGLENLNKLILKLKLNKKKS